MRKSALHFVDIAAWVDSGRIDPVQHRRRQATHILLAAIASIGPPYALYLKGGLLLGLVHNSPRMTTDIDLTADFQPCEGIDIEIKKALNETLPAMVAMLGYTGARAEVDKVKIRPKKFANDIAKASFPALRVTVRYDSGPGNQKYTDYITVDVSFNEPITASIDVFDIGDGLELHTYSLVEVIAEKYRALLQQADRRRSRRQDVYDLDFLRNTFEFDADQKACILKALIEKCRSRRIVPNIDSFDTRELMDKAGLEWDSIKLETGNLPEFDLCFESVQRFYKELPWDAEQQYA